MPAMNKWISIQSWTIHRGTLTPRLICSLTVESLRLFARGLSTQIKTDIDGRLVNGTGKPGRDIQPFFQETLFQCGLENTGSIFENELFREQKDRGPVQIRIARNID